MAERVCGASEQYLWIGEEGVVIILLYHAFFQNGRLPPVLYLQMDNCYRECKNRYIMAFCTFLVEKKYLRRWVD